MKKITFFLILFGSVLMSEWATAQADLADQLKTRLDGKDKLYEIMDEVERFYAPLSEEIKNGDGDIPKLKFWHRWALHWSSRLGPDGEFVHITKLVREAINDQPQRRSLAFDGDWKFEGANESSFAGTNGSLNGLGRVDRIAFHPTNANILFIGTPAGGIWKSTDGGATWAAKTDYMGTLGIADIVVDYANPNRIYALTGDGDSSNPNYFVSIFGYIRKSIGVIQSFDGGETWVPFGLPFPGVTDPYYGYALAQNPVDPLNLYAATTQGLFKTLNGGFSWTLDRAGNHFDVEFQPGQQVAYAADNTGVLRSVLPSLNVWIPGIFTPAGPLVNGRKKIAVTPASPNIVYLLCGGGGLAAGSFSGFFKSGDTGFSFTRMATTPNILGQNGTTADEQSIYDHCMAASPTDSTLAVTGGLTVWRTNNSGSTYTNVAPYWGNPAPAFSVHPDIHDLAYNPLDGKLYVCHDGGVNVSTNNGTSFTDISKGIQVSQIYHFDITDTKEYRMAIGCQDNGAKYRPKSTKDFMHVSSGDGYYPSFISGTDDQYYITINKSAYRYNMSTNTQTPIPESTVSSQFYKIIEAHPTIANNVFLGASNIFKSTNQGGTWSDKGAAGNWALTFDPSDPTKMYAAGRGSFDPGNDGKIYRSTNSGDSWTDITTKPGFPSSFTKITDISVFSSGSLNEVYACFGGFTAGVKVFVSSNGGESWGGTNFDLPNIPINCVERIGNNLFVGTDAGVYRRRVTETSWTNISDNLPNVPVSDLRYNANTGIIYVSTFGRGLWSYKYCVTNINLTAQLEGELDYSCNNLLTSTSTIPGNIENQVAFKAGSKIELKPGFKVLTGTHFTAKKGGCTNAVLPFTGSNDGTPDQERANELLRPSIAEKKN